MASEPNAYQLWLGIPPAEQPPNHYRLLGLLLYESNPALIIRGATRVLAIVQSNGSQHPELADRMAREVGAARDCLLDSRTKAEYDQQLRAQQAASTQHAPRVPERRVPEHPAVVPVPLAPAEALPLPPPLPPGGTLPRPIPVSPASSGIPNPAPVPLPAHPAPPQPVGTRASSNPSYRHRRPESSPAHTMGLVAKYVLGGLAGLMIGYLIVYSLTGQDVVGFLPTGDGKPQIDADANRKVAGNNRRREYPPSPVDRSNYAPRPATNDSETRADAATIPQTPPVSTDDPGVSGTGSTNLPSSPSATDPNSTNINRNNSARPAQQDAPSSDLSSLLTPRARQTPPSADQQQESLAKIQEIYDREFEQATKPEYARRFLIFLFARAREFRSDPLVQFVFLRQVYDLAVKQGQFEIAADAIDYLERDFVLDGYRLRQHLLQEAAKVAKLPEERAPLALFALDLAGHALVTDRPDDIPPLLESAESLGRGIASREFRVQFNACAEAARQAEREFQPVREARAQLASNPTDPAASLIEGKHRCFVQADWTRGLPLLAQGDDPQLSKLAAADLATSPDDRAATLSVGDQWFDLAESEPALAPAFLRAQHWYERAITGTEGLDRLRLDKRLEQIRSMNLQASAKPESPGEHPLLPTARSMLTRAAPLQSTNILERLTPQTLRSAGWTFTASRLRVDVRAPRARLQSPVNPAGEFDLEVRLRRTTSSPDPSRMGPLVIGLPGFPSQILVVIDHVVPGQGYASYLACGDSAKLDANPTITYSPDKSARLTTSRDVLITCAVRYGEVNVSVDGTPIASYQGDMSDLRMMPEWAVPDPRSLFIGSHLAGFEILEWRCGPPVDLGFRLPPAVTPSPQGFGPTPE